VTGENQRRGTQALDEISNYLRVIIDTLASRESGPSMAR
jgi:hypothetical protein